MYTLQIVTKYPHTHTQLNTSTIDLPLDFSEAQAKIKEDENTRRVEEGLTVGLTKEVRFLCMVLVSDHVQIIMTKTIMYQGMIGTVHPFL